MKALRDLASLKGRRFDVAIVGGGIYGAMTAWDAALRGLDVILLEREDFGGRTSANSLRIVHGGLRYLQHGDLRRMRESIRERSTLLRIAPHLVDAQRFMLPLYAGNLKKSRWALGVALRLTDWMGRDRNEGLSEDKRLFDGKVIGRDACLAEAPELPREGLTGAAVWSDGQMWSSERLIVAILRSAEAAGATLVNYARVREVIRDGDALVGLHVDDVDGGGEMRVFCRSLVNAAGPSIFDGFKGCPPPEPDVSFTVAMNLMVRKRLARCGTGFYRADGPVLFSLPWRGNTLIGTFHGPHAGPSSALGNVEGLVSRFLTSINAAWPSLRLTRADVVRVFAGLLPGRALPNGDVVLTKQYRLIDHQKDLGVRNAISVLGVKYTTARDVAEHTVDRILQKLGRSFVPSETAYTPVHGSPTVPLPEFIARQQERLADRMDPQAAERLSRNYGTDILRLVPDTGTRELDEPLTPNGRAFRSEIVHAVTVEKARRLADVVFRRTDVGLDGFPGDATLSACAHVMGGLLRWSRERIHAEIDEVLDLFSAGSRTPADALLQATPGR